MGPRRHEGLVVCPGSEKKGSSCHRVRSDLAPRTLEAIEADVAVVPVLAPEIIPNGPEAPAPALPIRRMAACGRIVRSKLITAKAPDHPMRRMAGFIQGTVIEPNLLPVTRVLQGTLSMHRDL
jgi:hypothetical protein